MHTRAPFPRGRRMLATTLLCAASTLALHSSGAAQSCTPFASPPAGPLCGATEPAVVNANTVPVRVFRGIPYAVPTTLNQNAGRWRPAVALPPWTTPRQATQFGQVCPQLLPDAAARRDTIGGGEDCLYLNVWQPPAASPASPLPVMVFIHGGTFFEGAGSLPQYDGSQLAAAGNVVVVTLNYRLGALGFLAADTLQASVPANLGLQDQQLALRWVQRNIAAFGGDPARVTLFGESAGAMSVGLHLFSIPGSAPLFRAAIMESNLMGLPYRGTAEALAGGNGFVKELCARVRGGCPGTPGWLQGLTTREIMQADSAFRGGEALKNRLFAWGMPEIIPWTPVVDGTLVTGQPAAGYAAGMPAKPYVFGMNQNEGVLFASLVRQAIGPLGLALEYDVMAAYLYGSQSVGTITGFKTPTGYPPYSNSLFTQDSSNHYLDRSQVALSNLLNDALFHCGNLAAADSVLAAGQPGTLPVFGYLFVQPPRFNHPPLAPPACVPQAGYVCHTYELPYVFDNLAYADSVPGSLQPPTPSDVALGQAMSAAWASFATTLGPPAAGWQPYTPNGGLYVWGGTTGGTMRQGWNAARSCSLWNRVPPRVG